MALHPHSQFVMHDSSSLLHIRTTEETERHKISSYVDPFMKRYTKDFSMTDHAEMLTKRYLNNEKIKKLNLHVPEQKGFFDGAELTESSWAGTSTTYKNDIDKDHVENLQKLIRERTVPEHLSYVKGYTFDPVSNKLDVEIETKKLDISRSQFGIESGGIQWEPVEPRHSYHNDCASTYRDHVMGRFPTPAYEFDMHPRDPMDYPRGGNPFLEPATKADKFQAQLKKNLTIIVKSRAAPINNVPENELIAIETLREMITETEFRKYIKYGFLLVRGTSGNVYQVFRNQSHTKVWKNGKLIEEICVRIDNDEIPPTDNVIAFKVLIEVSEEEFKKRGNVYPMAKAA